MISNVSFKSSYMIPYIDVHTNKGPAHKDKGDDEIVNTFLDYLEDNGINWNGLLNIERTNNSNGHGETHTTGSLKVNMTDDKDVNFEVFCKFKGINFVKNDR